MVRKMQSMKIVNLLVVLFMLLSMLPAGTVSAQNGYTCPCSLWPDPVTPTYEAYMNPAPIEVGMKFRSAVPGTVTGVRFFKRVGATGTHIGRLWAMNGVKLAEVTFTDETDSGWQSAAFSTPVVIQPNITYIISYYVADGNRMLSISQDYFTGYLGYTNGPLTALHDGEDGANGVFSETGGFFNQQNKSSNYWVDLVFDSSTPPADTTHPTVINQFPANNATGLAITTPVRAQFSEPMTASTITNGNFELRDDQSNVVPATVTYATSTYLAVLTPTSPLTRDKVYTAVVKTAAQDLAGLGLEQELSWSFRTEAPDTTAPAVAAVSPANGATGVLASDNLTARFNEAMTAASITTESFQLRLNGTPVSAVVTYDPATFTATLNPDLPLSPSTTYTGWLGAGIGGAPLDASGNALAEFTWTFTTTGPDLTAPTVVSVKPINGVSKLRLATKATAYFSEAIDPATLTPTTFDLRPEGGDPVTATITYNSADNSAVLDPASDLANGVTYVARLRGGDDGVKDVSGNPLATDYEWRFSTVAARPAVDAAPGGPILILTSPANLFTRYYVEIIRTEGFNEFALQDIATATAEILNGYDIVILGEMPLTADQVTLLTDWVTAGGHLIAMRPDKQLAGLLGLTDASATLAEAYLAIDTSSRAGTGIVGQTLQFHGTADLYTLDGATALATLYSNATTATPNPAVTVRAVGSSGGQAAAFTFDLARSIVFTHQGNPAWQKNHFNTMQDYGSALDLFADPVRNWIDFTKITIPQADEQQRFLANLIYQLNADKKPLPRFWYFPRGLKAAIILTGDDHIGRGSPSGSSKVFFDRHISQSPANCSALDWECVRSSSYGYVGNTITDAQYAAYTAMGFEFGVHADAGLSNGGGWCGTWGLNGADMLVDYTAQYDALFDKFASLPVQSSERNHCYSWFGYQGLTGYTSQDGWAYTSTPEAGMLNGIRLDTNISYNPGGWASVNPGYQMGSGMLMRFAKVTSTGQMLSVLDTYNGGTQMNDDNGQGAAAMRNIVDMYLDNATGPNGYYGAFVVNMHSDNWYGWSYDGSDQIVASAQAHQIPVVSGSQMVEWLDGRNSSYFSDLAWNGTTLSFHIHPGTGARNLQAMLPLRFGALPLGDLQMNGSPVSFHTETIKGIEYAIFNAVDGSYGAAYTPDTTAPVISAVTAQPAVDSTAAVTWATTEPATSRVDFGASADSLTSSVTSGTLANQHALTLTNLQPNTTYYYRVSSTDEAGNTAQYPAAGQPPASFVTPTNALIDTTVNDFSFGTPGADIAITHMANGEVMLTPVLYEEFNGTTMPSGWSGFIGVPLTAGTVTIGDGHLTIDNTNAGTTATTGPGHAIEVMATFSASTNQHVGFGVDYTAQAGDAWAIISTGAAGTQLIARSYTGTGSWDTQSTPITGNYFNSPHRYRVDWQANQIIFSIDGVVVATHNVTITTPMRPLFADSGAGGATLLVDQAQMGPFPTSGVFTSRVMDTRGSVTDGTIAWDEDLPAGTSLNLSIRTGSTFTPDASWSAFTPVTNGGTVGSGYRYIQYQASLATTDITTTPVLREVRILYNRIADTTPPQITARFPVVNALNAHADTVVRVTFNEPMDPATLTTSTFRLRAVGATEDVAAVVTYSGLTATLTPQSLLNSGQQYQVTVAGQVADISGNALGSDAAWSFHVIPQQGPPWYNSNWAYRRAISLTSGCAAAQADYPVKIVLDSSFDFAHARLDGGDVRVTASDGVTLLPYWIESWGASSAVIWVKLGSLPVTATNVYVYYGNPAAATTSNGANAFSFFDDFPGTSLDTNKWAYTVGLSTQAVVSGGIVTLTAGSNYIRIDSKTTFGTGYMVEAWARHPNAGMSGLIAEVGQTTPTDFSYDLRIVDDFPNIVNWTYLIAGSNTPVEMSSSPINKDWNRFRIGRANSQATFQVNDWTPAVASTTRTDNLGAFLMSYGSGNAFEVDWLFTRKWCGAENGAAVGSRENQNQPPAVTDDSYSVNKNTVLAVDAANGVLANDADADLDILTAVKVTDPAHGALEFNADGSFTYTPAADYHGPDSFTYLANDGINNSTAATVEITVNNTSTPPVFPSSFYGTLDFDSGAPAAGTVLTFSVSGMAAPAATALVVMNDGLPTYQVNVPGDRLDTPAKDGGEEGDIVTITMGGRVVGKGVWHTQTYVPLPIYARTVHLQEGWNLVSLRLSPVETTTPQVLHTILAACDLAYAYTAGGWLRYDNNPASPDTLLALNEGMGVWLHLTAAADLQVVGTLPTSTTIHLAAGWNLVGYPVNATPTNFTFPEQFSLVYGYQASDAADPWKMFDSGAPAYASDLENLTPGWGYWVRPAQVTDWVIPYQ